MVIFASKLCRLWIVTQDNNFCALPAWMNYKWRMCSKLNVKIWSQIVPKKHQINQLNSGRRLRMLNYKNRQKNSHAVKIKDPSVRKINIQKKKPVKLGVPDVVECKICHKVFFNNQGLASHLRFKHGCRLNYQPKLKCGKSFIS